MITIDPASAVPIYDQIKAGLKGLVAKGLLRPGDPAPTVRALAQRLKVNPNTAARALRELSQEGFLESRRGAPSAISKTAPRIAARGLSEVKDELREALARAQRDGLSPADVAAVIKEVQGGRP